MTTTFIPPMPNQHCHEGLTVLSWVQKVGRIAAQVSQQNKHQGFRRFRLWILSLGAHPYSCLFVFVKVCVLFEICRAIGE